MKVLTQNFKTGSLGVDEYPVPACPANGALVATTCSAVSLGTERAVYQLAAAPPWEKARRRPDLVKQVWNRAKNDGLLNTISVVRNLVSSPVALGYSSCGVVLEAGYRCAGVRPGDRVACAGFEFANHAEVNAVPHTMLARIPDGVPDEAACFATVASVSLHALRLCGAQTGETVLVLGLGLLGHLGAALAEIQGAAVIGYDPDPAQAASARARHPRGQFFDDPAALAGHLGAGADHVLVCASGGGASLFRLAGELARDRGTVVVVGDVECVLPRRLYYEKELRVQFSRAYGPGRYDPAYERAGQDYPIGYVRWTMQRNMEAILGLIGSGRLDVAGLITHRIPIADAADALKPLFEGVGDRAMGVVIEYPGYDLASDAPIPLRADSGAEKTSVSGRMTPAGKQAVDSVRIGLIGAGRFAQGVLIPAFRRAGADSFTRVASAGGLSAVSAGRKFGAREAVSRAEDVIGDPDTNALIITTRHGEHAALICAGLAAGKHVFCEKPLCLNTTELEAIEAAERASSGIFMAGFNRRFSPMLLALRDYLRFSNEPAMILYRVNAGALPPGHWVHDERDGGGRIIGECCHYLDVAGFLIGAPAMRIHATSVSGVAGTGYDTVTITAQYADGSVATIVFAANGNTAFSKEYLEVHRAGSSAFLYNYRRLVAKGPGGRLRRRALSQQKGFMEEARAFLDGCRGGAAPIPMAAMASVTRQTFAAMESLRTGMPVDLDPGSA